MIFVMLTINELARRTGISSSEIRRRVHAGQCPYIRVGATASGKVLINEDVFNKLLTDESYGNIESKNNAIATNDSADTVGFDRLRKID